MGSLLSTCCYESENELNLYETYTDLQSDLDPVTKGNRIWYTELQDVNYNVEAGEFFKITKCDKYLPLRWVEFQVNVSYVDIS